MSCPTLRDGFQILKDNGGMICSGFLAGVVSGSTRTITTIANRSFQSLCTKEIGWFGHGRNIVSVALQPVFHVGILKSLKILQNSKEEDALLPAAIRMAFVLALFFPGGVFSDSPLGTIPQNYDEAFDEATVVLLTTALAELPSGAAISVSAELGMRWISQLATGLSC